MKYLKTFFVPAAASLLFLAASCAKEHFAGSADTLADCEYTAVTLTAGFDTSVRTAVDAEGKVSWKAGDIIRYYSESGGAVGSATVGQDCAVAEFEATVAQNASFLVAACGGESLTGNTSGEVFSLEGAVCARQSGRFTDAHVAVARTEDPEAGVLTFRNLTALVKFTLERSDVALVSFTSNDQTLLHGDGVLNVTFSGGNPQASFGGSGGNSIEVSTSGAGTFFISSLPGTLGEGFTISCYDSGGKLLGEASTRKALVLKQGTITNLGTIDGRISTPAPDYDPDLSRSGTANCYIIPVGGEYFFDASVKGSSTEPVKGTPAGAKVLWESSVSGSAPSAGDIITGVGYSQGKISFTATGSDGNAVIALTDASGAVLWSWHIWCCKGYRPDECLQTYFNNAGVVMDRNLGAVSAVPGEAGALGLLYQWGRKDPFPGGYCATAPASLPSPVESDASTGTIAYSVANPTVFITCNEDNFNWLTKSDNTLWQDSGSPKGIYDPCPAGYRVPDGGGSGLWAKVLGTAAWNAKGCWDLNMKGINFGTNDKPLGPDKVIWYPAAGYINSTAGALNNVGYSGSYWSSTVDEDGSCCFNISPYFSSSTSYVQPNQTNDRAYAMSVRCVKE